METYQSAWPLYRRLGWTGVLPLRPGTKCPPPNGTTGWDGVDPSGADSAEYDELPVYRGTAQTALRMSSTVVGLDLDGYNGRTGARTVTEGIRRWGALPAGPWSSARDDGVSGIRFYRVPDGTVLVANMGFPELGIGHVELVQRHHRYAVTWPSIHRAIGAPYTWRGTAGPDVPPAVDDLPDLPETWISGLAGTGRAGERARPEQVARFLAELPPGSVCGSVRDAVRAADGSLQTPVVSRHDDTLAAVLRLLRLGERGHPGVLAALAALRIVFVRVVTADGSRTPASAVAEFDRMRDGANGIGLIEATPTPAGERGCRCATHSPTPTRAVITGILRSVVTAQGDRRPALLRWAVRKLRGYSAGGQLPDDYVARLVEQLTAASGGAR